MPDTFINRCEATISNTPGTSGGFTAAAALSGKRLPGAAQNGLTFTLTVEEGTSSEVINGCVWTNSTTSWSRGTLEESCIGGVVSTSTRVNFTSAAIVRATVSAKLLANKLVAYFTGAPQVAVNSLAATVCQTVNISASLIGPNTAIRIKSLWSLVNGTNAKYQAIAINTPGAGLSGAVDYLAYNSGNTGSATYETYIQFNNSLSSQMGNFATTPVDGPTVGGYTTSAFNGALGLDIHFYAFVANTAEFSVMRSYIIEVFG